MFWARASEVQALARGSARVPLDAMAAVWEGVQRYCGAEEWARVQAARAAGKTAAVPELPPVSWTAPAPPPRPVATVPRAAYVPTATESTPLSHSGHTSYSHRSGHSYDYSPHVEARATAGPSPWHVLAVATLRVFFMLLAAAAVGAVGYGVWAGVAALGHWVAHGGILGALKAAVGALWEAVRWVALGLWHLVSWVVLPLWHMVKALAVGLWKGVAGG
ncbi:hypothetical protein EDC01DRAFT_683117 [Geopyxis carbonaria]|nr:hypothetical protein EDC01DRAFT_683117 [Geopyxis carbonaria]